VSSEVLILCHLIALRRGKPSTNTGVGRGVLGKYKSTVVIGISTVPDIGSRKIAV
jgi:hypothetical protein